MRKKTKTFEYGEELFGDPYFEPDRKYSNKDYLKFLKGVYQEIELNTPDEKRAFKQIYEYFKDPSNLISKDVLENLKLLKDKFPNILDPLYDNLSNAYIVDETYYRGGSLSADQLKDLEFSAEKQYKKHSLNQAIIKKDKFVYEGTGKKHFLSFSRNFDTALDFALEPFQNKRILNKFLKSNRIPVIIGISGNDDNLILNPDFSDAVSPFWEDESIHVTNKVKVKELYIVNADQILDYYDRLDDNPERQNIRKEIRRKI